MMLFVLLHVRTKQQISFFSLSGPPTIYVILGNFFLSEVRLISLQFVYISVVEDISSLSPQAVLYRAAEAHNLPVMLSAVAARANVNEVSPTHNQRSPLHAAVLSVSFFIEKTTRDISPCHCLVLREGQNKVK